MKGSWDNWHAPVVLERVGNEWMKAFDVIPGTYVFKFIVDGNWKHLESLPHVVKDGNTNSMIIIMNFNVVLLFMIFF